jgi:hypothetical protein
MECISDTGQLKGAILIVLGSNYCVWVGGGVDRYIHIPSTVFFSCMLTVYMVNYSARLVIYMYMSYSFSENIMI